MKKYKFSKDRHIEFSKIFRFYENQLYDEFFILKYKIFRFKILKSHMVFKKNFSIL